MTASARARLRTTLAAAAAAAGLAASAGCQKVLFPKDTPRSQFESYDTMRQRYVPMQVPDVFGKPRPALRARLSPPSQ
jgi:hypothetical protein